VAPFVLRSLEPAPAPSITSFEQLDAYCHRHHAARGVELMHRPRA